MSRKGGINPDVERTIADLLKAVKNDPDIPLEDKLKVIDRALKVEALKLKARDEEYGSGFDVDTD